MKGIVEFFGVSSAAKDSIKQNRSYLSESFAALDTPKNSTIPFMDIHFLPHHPGDRTAPRTDLEIGVPDQVEEVIHIFWCRHGAIIERDTFELFMH